MSQSLKSKKFHTLRQQVIEEVENSSQLSSILHDKNSSDAIICEYGPAFESFRPREEHLPTFGRQNKLRLQGVDSDSKPLNQPAAVQPHLSGPACDSFETRQTK